MKYETLNFTPENLERHLKKDLRVIYTTRDHKLDYDTTYIIPGTGRFCHVTDHWTFTKPQFLKFAIEFYKQEGFSTPLEYLREVSRIYADADGNLPPLCVHRLEISKLIFQPVAFEEILPLIKKGIPATRTEWCNYASTPYLTTADSDVHTICLKYTSCTETHFASLHPADIMAEDWVLYEGGAV